MHRIVTLCTVLCAFPFFSAIYAQVDQGSVAGTIKDSSDAVITGATVTVRNAQSNITRSAASGSNGAYVLPSLPAGSYELTVEAPGFKRFVERDVRVISATRTTLDPVLQLGEVSETVDVTAAAALVQSETAQIGRYIDSNKIVDLALNGRNPIKLATLQAGVIGAENFNDFAPVQLHEQFSINGGRRAGNNVIIDGVNADRTRGDYNGNAELGILNADAVQEVQILASTYPAEFGHTQDGQIIFVSKSGTRDFHGSIYEFFRNSALDANTWTRNQSPYRSDNTRPAPFRYNEPGYSIGGPIFIPHKFNSNRDKLFFFASEEWMYYRQDKTSTGVVPSLQMRQGDFSELLNPNNTYFKKVRTITDPLNGGAVFAGNIIPQSRLSPNGIGMLNAYPLPTPGFFQGSSNWIETLPHPETSRRDSIRLDYYINDKNRINFSGTYFTYIEYDPFANTGGLDRSNSLWNRPNKTASIGLTSTISPTKVNQITFGAAEDIVYINLFNEKVAPGVNGVGANGQAWTREQYGINYPYFIPGQLEIQDRIPDAIVTGFSQLDGSARPESSTGPMFSLADNFTWIKTSTHTLKFGASIEDDQQNNNDQHGVQNGTFTFTDTGNPVTTGLAIANVALGQFNTAAFVGPAAYTLLRSWAFESYAQDTWKVTPHLTIEYGVRYAYYQPWWAKWNDIANFYPSYYNRANAAVIDPTLGYIVSGSPYNGIVLPGSGYPSSAAGRAIGASIPGTQALFHDLPRSLEKAYHDAFAPRLGIAYRPFNKTVIRAGAGVFHQRQMQNQTALFGNPPNQQAVTLVNGNVDVPGGGQTNYPYTFKAMDPNDKYPTAYSYSFSIQRELPAGMVLDVAYVGKMAVNQERETALNFLPVGTVQKYPNVNQAALRPYVGLGQITWVTRDGRTEYNSLQVVLERRFQSGLGLGFAYTFSKNLDNLMNLISPMLPYDPYHFVRGIDELDRTNILNVNYIYELPFFRGQHGFRGNAFGGWQLSGVFVARSGAPLAVGYPASQVDYAGVGVGLAPQPWNVIGNVNPTTASKGAIGQQWFNPAAFAPPAPGTFGNAPLGSLIRGPGFWNLDQAIFKDFRVTERISSQFRLEVFDLPNHAFLANPGTDPTNTATFGIITAKGSTAVASSTSAASVAQRSFQLVLKFRF